MGSSTKIIGMVAIVVTFIALSVSHIMSIVSPTASSGLSEEEVRDIVKDYIAQNPQEIMASIENHFNQQKQIKAAEAQNAIKNDWDKIANNPKDPIVGNPDGDVTVVEFFDYSCGYCRKVLPSIAQLLDVDKNVKVVFKELPILGQRSNMASMAALAVHDIAPEKYWDFHKALFEGRITTQTAILDKASKLGIDKEKLSQAPKSPSIQDTINNNQLLARRLGINGTPAFIINGELIPGAVGFETLLEEVNKARK